jgi:uncharacterized membrane protein
VHSSGEENLSRQQRRQLERRTELTIEAWGGPLPHPNALARFEEVQPGLANIIVGEFQAQASHRRDLEGRVVRSNVRHAFLGQLFAFVLLGGLIGGGIFLIHEGRDAAGLVAIGGAVVSGLWALTAARKAKQQDTAGKRNQPSGRR